MKNTDTHRKCNKCNTVKELTSDNYKRDKAKKFGFGYTCKQCRYLQLNTRYKELSTANLRVKSYKKTDRKKNRDTNITESIVTELLNRHCVYCGYPSTGLDRIDNTLGHSIENCVPCCKECNIARNDLFTSEEMLIIGKAIKQVKDKRL